MLQLSQVPQVIRVHRARLQQLRDLLVIRAQQAPVAPHQRSQVLQEILVQLVLAELHPQSPGQLEIRAQQAPPAPHQRLRVQLVIQGQQAPVGQQVP